jgi:hypothetical protein
VAHTNIEWRATLPPSASASASADFTVSFVHACITGSMKDLYYTLGHHWTRRRRQLRRWRCNNDDTCCCLVFGTVTVTATSEGDSPVIWTEPNEAMTMALVEMTTNCCCATAAAAPAILISILIRCRGGGGRGGGGRGGGGRGIDVYRFGQHSIRVRVPTEQLEDTITTTASTTTASVTAASATTICGSTAATSTATTCVTAGAVLTGPILPVSVPCSCSHEQSILILHCLAHQYGIG